MATYTSRAEVPAQEKWDFTDIYPGLSEWEEDVAKISEGIKELKGFDGAISDGSSLYSFLKRQEEIEYIFSKVYVYAMLHSDVDTRDSEAQTLTEKASQLGVQLSAATSFFTPYLLALDERTLKDYLAEAEGLKYFEDALFKTYRYKPHVLDKEREELISQMGEALAAPSKTYNMLNNADIQFGNVTTDDGEIVELTRGMYAKLIKDENRNKREEAYRAYYKPYVQLNNSLASTLAAAVKNNVLLSKLKEYPSALEKALFADKVPKEVYEQLIETTKKIHRALSQVQFHSERRSRCGRAAAIRSECSFSS